MDRLAVGAPSSSCCPAGALHTAAALVAGALDTRTTATSAVAATAPVECGRGTSPLDATAAATAAVMLAPGAASPSATGVAGRTKAAAGDVTAAASSSATAASAHD